MGVDPEREAIFDFLPDSLLHKVTNPCDFLGILVFDKWVGNNDSRQAVFFHGQNATRIDPAYRNGRCAQMIDHGGAFNGARWDFSDKPTSGVYFKKNVYRDVSSIDSFEPWIALIQNLSEEALRRAASQIPEAWLESNEAEFGRLLDTLHARQSNVVRFIEEVKVCQPDIFPNWETVPKAFGPKDLLRGIKSVKCECPPIRRPFGSVTKPNRAETIKEKMRSSEC